MISLPLEQLITLGLEEDLGNGDVTTAAVVDPALRGVGQIVSREPLVVSGIEVARRVFAQVDPELKLVVTSADGESVPPGAGLMRIEGSLASILSGERLALNFLGRLCGVATHTRKYVDAIAGLKARVVDTRKTTPGFRTLEKAAVRHGGGHNHRFNLSDGILIKDNHVMAAGGVRPAIERARKNAAHHLIRIEVEVDTLAQLEEALELGVEAVLLDNMSIDELKQAVALTRGRALLEASGGVKLDTVRAIAETGVDLISAGSLIHGARWVDVSLDLLSRDSAGV